MMSALTAMMCAPVLSGEDKAITYDKFMKHSLQERKRLFSKLPPEQKAELMLTQGQRCLQVYEGKFTPTQRSLIAESLALVSPDMYAEPNGTASDQREAKQAKARELLDRLRETELDPFYVRQCFSLDGTVPRAK
jgi:hypothetical protein